MRIRDKLNQAILDFGDINLGSETARNALIDRIIDIVQREPVDSKYWNVGRSTVQLEKDKETGEIIHPD